VSAWRSILGLVLMGVLLLATPAAAYRAPGGLHPLYRGGDNGTFPPLVTAVDDRPTPTTVRLAVRAFPNPARGLIRFRAATPAGAPVRLRVFNVAGRLVREWRGQGEGQGPAEWSWDGRDARGRLTGPGLYFYLAESGAQRVTGKVVLLGGSE
jgi:hypothetical protein